MCTGQKKDDERTRQDDGKSFALDRKFSWIKVHYCGLAMFREHSLTT